ncbi:hypothetical protein [Chryseobacterium gambrini]|uniref:Uncharacterized protein n=1 Tax=Chryseobacterium gambrini TaxID=373672 RepID=A0ABM8K7K7_9FLAO|nr:hypothetical protein CRDW_24010 [Chryseobacterium gambrini]
MNNQIKMYKRREFLSKLVLTSSLGFFSPILKPIILSKSFFNGKVLSDPMTAISIAKMSLDVISTFSESKNSAMSAMIQYQVSLLQQVITQINQVQDKLLEVENAIKNLPEEFKEILEEQFKIELIVNIRAAAQRYTTNVLIPSLTNPLIIQNEQVKKEISDIMYICDQKNTSLQLMNNVGPQACMILPLALSLNIACRTSLKYPKEVIISSLNWFMNIVDDMLSDKKGSISDYIKIAAEKHDTILSELDSDRLANRLEIQNFKLNGNQKGKIIPDPAIVFSYFPPNQIEGISIDKYGGTTEAQALKNITRAIYRKDSNLYSYHDKILDGFLIGYKRHYTRIYSRDEPINFTSLSPIPGEYHYIYGIDSSRKYTASKIIEIIEKGNTNANVDDVSRAKINLKIAEANLERAKIMFGAQANIVALNTKYRIQEYINILK